MRCRSNWAFPAQVRGDRGSSGQHGLASTPVTLAMFWPDIQPGQRVLVLTYGSGATWGAALYRKPEEVNRPC